MTVTEKVAYLKGLIDGLELDTESKEGKAIKAIVDALEDIAFTMEDLDDGLTEVAEQVDAIDEDLDALEEDYYEFDEDEACHCHDDDDDYEFGDEDLYEVTCPSCGDTICIDETMLEDGKMDCPNCGELLEFEVDCGCDDCAESDEEDK